MNKQSRQAWTIAGLTAPAYIWLTITVLLPLTAMLYFSFLTATPMGGKEASFTLKHYIGFFQKRIYWYNAWRSIELGLYVTTCCLLLAYPAALGLAKVVKGRAREAIFLLIILPFWSNALVRTFSWTMVLRAPLDILYTYPAIVIGLVHAYLPYAILTIYVSLQVDRRFADRGVAILGATPLAGVPPHHAAAQPARRAGGRVPDLRACHRLLHGAAHPRRQAGDHARADHRRASSLSIDNWPLGAALSFIMLAIVLIILGVSSPGDQALSREELMTRLAKIYLRAVLLFLYLPIARDDGDGLQPVGALRAALHLRPRLVQGADGE